MGRIALFSDIHFGIFSRTSELSVPGMPIQDETNGGAHLIEGLITLLKEEEIEYLFIAGDLTSVGSPQEFYYCEEQILRIAKEIGILDKNIICCLGNHDVDRKIVELRNVDYFDELSSDVQQKMTEKYQLIAASSALCCCDKMRTPKIEGPAPFSGIIENDEFVTFILNSSWQCSQIQEIPHGKLAENQLEWFQDNCKRYSNDERAKIVLMHHHPISYPYPKLGHDISMIEENSELLEIAGKNGINLIVHGHRHHPKATTIMHDGWKNPIAFICAGSLSVNTKHRNNGEIPNTMHIIDINNKTDSITLYNYQFTSSQGWTPFDKISPETPMDAKMILGRVVDDKTIKGEILRYRDYKEVEIKWDTISESLKYMDFNSLNTRFSELLSDTHKIFGKFPESVMIIEKGAC